MGANTIVYCVFFFQAEDGIRDYKVNGVQTCALPIYFLGVERDSPERKPRQECVEKKISKLASLQIVFFAANRTMAVGIQLVDDDVVNGELEAVRLSHDRDGLAQAHFLGQHHGNKTAAARVLEDGFHPPY